MAIVLYYSVRGRKARKDRIVGAAEQKTLLLVEDEPLVAVVERKTLERFGYNVITVETGEKAVATVVADPTGIDLILMDIDLGRGIDGTQAAEQILATHDIPLVFLSSHTEPEYVERTEGITSYGYIVKNTGETVLRASLAMAFRLYEANRAKTRLQEKEVFQNTLVNSSPLPIIGIDNAEHITVWNPAAERVFGWKAEEVVGSPLPYHPPHESPETKPVHLNEVDSLTIQDVVRQTKDGTLLEMRLWLSPIRNAAEESLGGVAIVEDITESNCERRATEIEKQRFQHLFEMSPNAIAVVDEHHRVLQCNRRFTELFGFSAEEMVGHSINKRIVPQHLMDEATTIDEQLVHQDAYSLYRETDRLRKDNTPVSVAISGRSLQLGDRRYAYLVYEDITERKRMEERLRESETMFRSITEHAFDSIVLLDLHGRHLYVNPGSCRLAGVALEHLVGRKAVEFVHPDDCEGAIKLFRDAVQGTATPGRAECRMLRADGSYVWVDYLATALHDSNGNAEKVLVIGREIEDHKRYEQHVTALLQQKELLLRETHHRVKNNMAAISGLLAYHAEELSDHDAREVLRDSANRAQSMTVLYDRLSRAGRYDRLNVREYLGPLVRDTVALNDPRGCLSTRIKACEFSLPAAVLAPIGLLVTELVTNSVKHAFPGNKPGEISLQMTKQAGEVRIEYADTGVGMTDTTNSHAQAGAAGHERTSNEGFGLQLIEVLVSQIKGTLEVNNDAGTRYVITFPG